MSAANPARSLFFLPLILAVAPTWNWAADEEQESDPKQDKPHYRLVMSEDDKVCKPLAGLYNRLLAEFAAEKHFNNVITKYTCDGKDEPRAGCYEPHYWASNFEAKYPDEFERIGFMLPPVTEFSYVTKVPEGVALDPHRRASLYLVDLFDEGKPRMIRLYDRPSGNSISETIVETLKKDLTQADYRGDDSDVDREVGFGGLLADQTSKHIRHMHGYYSLTKWPGFEKQYKAFIDSTPDNYNQWHPKDWPHAMVGSYSIRIIIHENHPYFIMNNFMRGRPKSDTESTVLVYRWTKTGADDICYLNSGG